MCMTVHGDDFNSDGRLADLRWVETRLKGDLRAEDCGDRRGRETPERCARTKPDHAMRQARHHVGGWPAPRGVGVGGPGLERRGLHAGGDAWEQGRDQREGVDEEEGGWRGVWV